MLRIDVPAGSDPRTLSGLAAEITRAGRQFSLETYQHSKLSLREFEGARARTAEIHGCRRCQAWRSARDLPDYFAAFDSVPEHSIVERGPAPDESFYAAVSEWRASPLYSPRERLAIEYAERLGTEPQAVAADD